LISAIHHQQCNSLAVTFFDTFQYPGTFLWAVCTVYDTYI